MLKTFILWLLIGSVTAFAQAPGPDPRPLLNWDDRPGVNFDPHSTAGAPCGTGTPPRGHFASEVGPAALAAGLSLVVRQDPNRLCYVAEGIADAPVLRVRQGQQLVVTLGNEITDPAAIDGYVAVRRLDEANRPVASGQGYLEVLPGMHHTATGATNLHVHGFAVPAVRPQDEVMATCVDPAVGAPTCGQRAFTYRYAIPADMPAGLYWYHPHVHGEVQAQMMMGLAGAIVVEGPEDDARRAAGIEDRIFVVRQTQDTDAKRAGSQPQVAGVVLPEPAHHPRRPKPDLGALAIDTDDELPCSNSTGVDKISLNGAKVIDGRVRDVDVAQVDIPAGRTELWRVLNAATDAYLNLAVIDQSGMPVPLEIVARDGAPLTDDDGKRLTPAPVTDYQLVPPAGRLEFLVHAPPAGQKAYLVSHGVDTGCAGDKVPERKLVLIKAGPAPDSTVASIDVASAPAPAPPPEAPFAKTMFSGLLARKTDIVRTLALAEYPRPGQDDSSDFYIVERKPGATLKPFMMNDGPTITTHAGAVEEWIVENWTNELHAFHIHQVHFRVLAINGVKLPDPPLVDTVSVPYATSGDVTDGTIPVVPGRVRIKLALPEELAGDIPFHCHLVDHEDNGMMGILRVLAPNEKPDTRKSALPQDHSLAWLLAHPALCVAPSTAVAPKTP